MRKLGTLRALSVKVGDLVKVNEYHTAVSSVKELPCGYIEIETAMFNPSVYHPCDQIGIYSQY